MALTIEYEYKAPLESYPSKRWLTWHYSEPLPEWVLRARVLKITADGDELELLLGALQATTKPTKTIDVTPGTPPLLTGGTDENSNR